jgi:Flp pilus assembly protein TadG
MKIGCRLRRIAMLLVSRQKICRRFKGEEGQSLVEIAFTLPLMLLILTGTVSFSLAFYNMQQLENAVTAAGQGLGATAGVAPDPCAQVVSQVQAALPGWTTSNLTYKVVITNAAGTATTYGPTAGSLSCAAAGSGGAVSTAEAANEPQTVTVSYSYTWFTVFTWKPFGNSSPSSALTYSYSTMAD